MGDIGDVTIDDPRFTAIQHDFHTSEDAIDAVNQIFATFTNRWCLYCYNAEYLFFPFSETRTVGELLTFCTEELRLSVVSFIVDLYTEGLNAAPSAVDIEIAHFDRAGYFARERKNGAGHILEHQLDFCSGLKSRYEEFVAPSKRRMDRVAIFNGCKECKTAAQPYAIRR